MKPYAANDVLGNQSEHEAEREKGTANCTTKPRTAKPHTAASRHDIRRGRHKPAPTSASHAVRNTCRRDPPKNEPQSPPALRRAIVHGHQRASEQPPHHHRSRQPGPTLQRSTALANSTGSSRAHPDVDRVVWFPRQGPWAHNSPLVAPGDHIRHVRLSLPCKDPRHRAAAPSPPPPQAACKMAMHNWLWTRRP